MRRAPSLVARLLPIASATHPTSRVLRSLRQFDPLFDAAMAPTITSEAPWSSSHDALAANSLLVPLVVTGGTENTVLRTLDKLEPHYRARNWPLLAHAGENSLPAALETVARLHQDGDRARVIYLRGPEDKTGVQQLNKAVQQAAVRRHLSGLRVGMLGDPSDWLVASSPSPDVVRDAWGVHVQRVSLDEFFDAYQAQSHGSDDDKGLVEGALSVAGDVQEGAVGEASRVFASLRQIVDRHRLDSITVRCFDMVVKLQTTSCFALAQLTDSGILAGCEGDIVSLVGMLWSQAMLADKTEDAPWMANPARIDVDANTVLLAHCTVPRKLVHGYHLDTHFESGLGVSLRGELGLGPVTLLRLGGSSMRDIWCAEGEAIENPHHADLCRTQVVVQLAQDGAAEHVRDLLERPLGNHIVFLRGHHRQALMDYHRDQVQCRTCSSRT